MHTAHTEPPTTRFTLPGPNSVSQRSIMELEQYEFIPILTQNQA